MSIEMISIMNNTPIGNLIIESRDNYITRLIFADDAPLPESRGGNSVTDQCKMELEEYFKGERTQFSVGIKPQGTDFRQRVWAQLAEIPYGETISYGELARRLGIPKAARAVGGANHHNPIPIIIPCHRVLGADGKLVGYGGGLWRKERLIALEMKNKKEHNFK
jgi:methylated-DNA-[protein]-cysteine S-methyltransferase